MFGTLFLGAVLAVFLTLSVVRGDAERGLLQPLVVRPLGRELAPRGGCFAAAALVCGRRTSRFVLRRRVPVIIVLGRAAGGRTAFLASRGGSGVRRW